MYLIKQYIAQLIIVASNNLRLSSEKIEVVAMFRDFILNSTDLQTDISSMKKITELSKLAIKLQMSYNSVAANKIDFMKISQQFKSQSASLVSEVNFLLSNSNPSEFKEIIEKLLDYRQQGKDDNADDAAEEKPKLIPETPEEVAAAEEISGSVETESSSDAQPESETENLETIDLTKKKDDSQFFQVSLTGRNKKDLQNDENESAPLPNIKQTLLKPVKRLDALFDRLQSGNIVIDELAQYIGLLESNGKICRDIGLSGIGDYHQTLASSLILIDKKKLSIDKTIIEAMRACLIVIVATVKQKEVDVSKYQLIADNFTDHILKMTGEEN